MKLRKLENDAWPVLPEPSILDSTINLFLNDEFIRSPSANPNIQFADYYIQRGKKTLFINIGESWTYGETLPRLNGDGHIITGSDKYDFGSQLLFSFGPNLSIMLDSDLYQYAVPGNSNVNMLTELDRILNFVQNNTQYEKIYLAMQATECNRDFVYNTLDYCKNSPLYKILHVNNIKLPMLLKDWVTMYYDILQDWYQDTLNKYSNLNIDSILWSNFCTFESHKEYTFKRIKPTWIAYSAQLENKEYEQPLFFNTGMLTSIEDTFKNNIIIDKDWAMHQMDLIDKSLKFIAIESKYHNNHPNIEGHRVWASYLAKMSGWLPNI